MSKAMSGFVYIWFDRKHKRYYVGSHWGHEDDRYVCSSIWMRNTYKRRPEDFKRRVIARVTTTRIDLFTEEQRWLDMIKPEEIKIRYFNLDLRTKNSWFLDPERAKTTGARISASKTGKNTGPRDPSVGARISAVKKGKPLTEAHKQALRNAKAGKNYPHTDEWKRLNSERMKVIWAQRLE